jgi:diadenosine tetraphosphate (Ap4A) HIT family hydrolase/GNAT superfamily N-acetyltransferase
VLVRAARPEDFDRVREIEVLAGAMFRDVGLAEIAEHEPPDAGELAGAAALFVVEDGEGTVVGYAQVEVVDGHAHLEQVSVVPEAGGRGFGTALLDAVAAWATERGDREITLTTFRDVAFNAPLYAKRGYEVVRADERGPELVSLMAEEAAHGLDPARRVAMRRRLWPADWAARKAGAGCPMCEPGGEDTPHGVRVFAGEFVDAYLGRYAIRPGYTFAIWNGRHVAEPHELDAAEAAGFWGEVGRVAAALERLHRPAKLNWLHLGNGVPHLHVHLVPRPHVDARAGGPLEDGAFDQLPHRRVDDGELRARAAALRAELAGDEVAPDGSPVALYLALDGEEEAAIVDAAIPPGAPILELGCGPGRVTRHLVRRGHRVTGVDNGPAMVDALRSVGPDVEGIVADIAGLELGRTWPVVLFASHLVNDVDGEALLAAAARHLDPDPAAALVLQRYPPGWVPAAAPMRRDRGHVQTALTDVEHPAPGVLRATMVYEVGDRTFRQPFEAREVDDERLTDLADGAGLRIAERLTDDGGWVVLRRRA